MVCHLRVWRMPRKCYTQWVEHISLMIQLHRLCIDKLMEIMLQENKNREITTGNSTQQNIDLVSVKRKFLMVLPSLFIMRDTKSNSQRPSSSKKLLKITKLYHQTSSESQRTLDRVKPTEVQISFTESKTSLVTIHGTPLDASTVSPLKERSNQTTILENQ